ncbi:MAG TPA: hypothetical protein VGV67_02455 [Solirubrobacteraceae bacterium]|nr:hypothetical protein [Solirubrobacteraceae bacterium]
MNDKLKTKQDPIRKLLAGIPPAMFLGNPPGTVAIWQSRVIEAGGDPDAVLAWVREHGGYPDRSFPVSARQGLRLGPQSETKHFYVIPESALS